MSTENETWRDTSSAAENPGTDRDGNQTDKEKDSGYTYRSYNRENSDRPYRPKSNSGNSNYQQRSYGNERPHRPRFNPNADVADRSRMYSNDYYQYGNNDRTYNRDRSYRPRYNDENPDRSYRSPQQRPYNNNERPYRPRFNQNAEHPQRSYNKDRFYNNNNDRSTYGNMDRSLRSRYNYNNEEDVRVQRPYANVMNRPEGRPRFNPSIGGNRPYNNNSRFQRIESSRPKFNKKKQIEYKEQEIDPNEPIRLNKYLANAGICSRREADEFITAGVVSVNGEIVKELGTKIKRGDEVKFRDKIVTIERKIYVLLNKPKDTVTTSDDPQERRTVMDLVKGACQERIYPVGRLDRNTTGVLLLTNDGDLASKLTHPKYMKKKIYHVRLDKNLIKNDMDQIASGIQLDDGEVHADAINYTDENKKNDIGIEIHSGKNRIVRRIFETLGYKVVKLDRVYFAGLTKKGLRRGDWRYLTEQEVNFLRMGSFE